MLPGSARLLQVTQLAKGPLPGMAASGAARPFISDRRSKEAASYQIKPSIDFTGCSTISAIAALPTSNAT